MNPVEKVREFRESLRQKDPERAIRYERLKSLKDQTLTSNSAHDCLAYDTLEQVVDDKLVELAASIATSSTFSSTIDFVLSGRHYIVDLWLGYSQLKISYPCERLPLDMIGVKSLDLLINLYSEYLGAENIDEQGNYVSFPDFLKKRVISVSLNPRHHRMTTHGLFGIHTPYHPSRYSPIDTTINFYFKQYKRLEREKLVGTSVSENIILPALRAIGKSANCSEESIIRTINRLCDPTIIFTIDELEAAVGYGIQDAERKVEALDVLYHIRKKLEFIKEELDFEGRITLRSIPYKVELLDEDRNIGNEIYNAALSYFDSLPVENNQNIQAFERKLRESESLLETKAADADPRESYKPKEDALINRFILYCMQLYRRHRQEIDKIIERADGGEELWMEMCRKQDQKRREFADKVKAKMTKG